MTLLNPRQGINKAQREAPQEYILKKGVLTKELSGIRIACGFFIVGEAFVDDLANSSVQTFQLLIL